VRTIRRILLAPLSALAAFGRLLAEAFMILEEPDDVPEPR
jgi:hypothetical protein